MVFSISHICHACIITYPFKSYIHVVIQLYIPYYSYVGILLYNRSMYNPTINSYSLSVAYYMCILIICIHHLQLVLSFRLHGDIEAETEKFTVWSESKTTNNRLQ